MPKGRHGRQLKAGILLFGGGNVLAKPPSGRDHRWHLESDPGWVGSV